MLQSTPACTVLRPPSSVSRRRPSSSSFFTSSRRLRPLSLSALTFFLFRSSCVSVPLVSSSHFHSNVGPSFRTLRFLPPPRDISIRRQQASSTIPSFSEPPTVGTMRNAFLWLKFSDAGSLFRGVSWRTKCAEHVYVRAGVEGGFPEDQDVEIFDERLSECRVTRRSCRWGIWG